MKSESGFSLAIASQPFGNFVFDAEWRRPVGYFHLWNLQVKFLPEHIIVFLDFSLFLCFENKKITGPLIHAMSLSHYDLKALFIFF